MTKLYVKFFTNISGLIGRKENNGHDNYSIKDYVKIKEK